ncbi:MAG: L-threonylcarbamoyladenylate synthase [Colwellia sp.]
MIHCAVIEEAAQIFAQGGIIAYPTEAVFGLGCDPDNEDALKRLLKLKKRPTEKGLILLAGSYSQLLPYIDDSKIPPDKRFALLSRWPDGITQLVPKNDNTSSLLSGSFDTIAVRITSQPNVVALCKQTNKPIVSTSANLSGQEPAKTWQSLAPVLAKQVDFIIEGLTLGHTSPSKIIDVLTGKIIRN